MLPDIEANCRHKGTESLVLLLLVAERNCTRSDLFAGLGKQGFAQIYSVFFQTFRHSYYTDRKHSTSLQK
jgi:hypothetical protein